MNAPTEYPWLIKTVCIAATQDPLPLVPATVINAGLDSGETSAVSRDQTCPTRAKPKSISLG